MLRFSTKVEAKRIPKEPDDEKSATLLSSQDASLKNTDSLSQSQSQSQPEAELDVTPFTLTRTHSTFFSASSSASEHTPKRHKSFHAASDSKDEKSDEKKPATVSIPPLTHLVSQSQPLIACIEGHLSKIQLDTEAEKNLVARFLYRFAHACQDKNITDAAYAPRTFKPRKQSAASKPEDTKKVAAKKANKLSKARTADKLLLDNLIMHCIIAAAALGDRKAELALQKYKEKQAKKPTRRLKAPLPTVDPLFTGNPTSYLPGLRKLMQTLAADLDFHFSAEKVQAMVQSLMTFVDAHFKEYRQTLLPSSSLSLRR